MIADSSFLVSLFLNDDSLHEKATGQASLIAGSSVIVPSSILEETFTAITYKRGAHYALEVLENIQKNKNFLAYHLTPEEWQEIPKLACALKKKMSFADYFVLYLCKKTGEAPLCFDKQILSILKKL